MKLQKQATQRNSQEETLTKLLCLLLEKSVDLVGQLRKVLLTEIILSDVMSTQSILQDVVSCHEAASLQEVEAEQELPQARTHIRHLLLVSHN